jgi:hypothetical protein
MLPVHTPLENQSVLEYGNIFLLALAPGRPQSARPFGTQE